MTTFSVTARRALVAAGVVCSLMTTSAFAQTTPVFNVNASATVVTPVTIASASTLNFGAFAPGSSDGTVVIPSAGSRSGTNVILMATNVGAPSTITVAGDPNMSVTLDLPGAVTTLVSGQNQMTVDKFETNLAKNTRLLPNGTLSFQLGATLNVKANQATGTYSGTVPITVSYN